MTRTELHELHTLAVIARDHAHNAYFTALRDSRPSDTNDAYAALAAANHLRDRIYKAILQDSSGPHLHPLDAVSAYPTIEDEEH